VGCSSATDPNWPRTRSVRGPPDVADAMEAEPARPLEEIFKKTTSGSSPTVGRRGPMRPHHTGHLLFVVSVSGANKPIPPSKHLSRVKFLA
jgi:hypothetical protein